MASSNDPGSPGGRMAIWMAEVPPTPDVSVTIDEMGTVDPDTGAATISGSYSCAGPADDTSIYLELAQQQRNGQLRAEGRQLGLACDGTFDWRIETTPEQGKFVPGPIAAHVKPISCEGIRCVHRDKRSVVDLAG